jgi:hypothetical protein
VEKMMGKWVGPRGVSRGMGKREMGERGVGESEGWGGGGLDD